MNAPTTSNTSNKASTPPPLKDLLICNSNDEEEWVFSIHPRLEPHQRRSLRNLVSLRRSGAAANSGGSSSPSTSAPGSIHHDPNHDICWSYGKRSTKHNEPSWYITSSSLLEVTYKPRHEAFPFYTNTTKGSVGKLTNLATCGGRFGGYKSKQQQDFFAETSNNNSTKNAKLKYSGLQKEIYTQNDILRIEHLDQIDIMPRSVSEQNKNNDIPDLVTTKWKGVNIYLKAHERHTTSSTATSTASSRPATGSLQGGGKAQPQQQDNSDSSSSSSEDNNGIEFGKNTLSNQTPLLYGDGKLDSPPRRHHYGDNHEKNTSKNNNDNVIILTFAIPSSTSSSDEIDEEEGVLASMPKEENDAPSSSSPPPPPLLWKVDFPLHSSISLEHLTVLNGGIHYSKYPTTTTTAAQHGGKHSPTHVYINGWQSWSFTGSVARENPQPGSAMPDYLSKAFNHGGTCPPKVSPHKTWVRSKPIVTSSSTTNETNASSSSSSLVPLGLKTLLYHAPQYYKSDMFTALSYNSKFSSSKEDQMLDTNNTFCAIVGWISQRSQFGMIGISDDLLKVAMHCTCDGMVSNVQTPLPTKQFVNTDSMKDEQKHKRTYKDLDQYNRRTRIETDWAWCQIHQQQELNDDEEHDDPFMNYIDVTGYYNQARHCLREPLSSGWCSWYHYYENLDEVTLIENFNSLEKLSDRGMTFNMSMCDDGYMTFWGDWDDIKPKDKFPSQQEAMKKIAQGMVDRNMRPGVWLAPFGADKKSKLTKSHQEWIIQNHSGMTANSSNCGKFFHGLDATNPAVLQHATKTIHRAVNNWGYQVLKLDFLYGSCLEGNGKYNLSMTRAETMTLALQTLRNAAGDDVFIIGCGCPIGSGIGYVDGMRVSADTGPKWDPYFPLPWWDHGTLPCVRNMIRNSLTRMSLSHRWWHNDPDCLLLGKTTSLSKEEIVSAASVIALSGGMLLLSDDLPSLTQDRFDIATKIYPICDGVAQPLDLLTSYGSTPSLLRLYCSDNVVDDDSNNKLTTQVSQHKTGWKRNCIKVSKGLGTWTILSLSNWLEVPAMVSAPFKTTTNVPTSLAKNTNSTTTTPLGYHVLAFWSSKYVFVPCSSEEGGMPSLQSLSKRLKSHETEIFHIKPMLTTDQPYYIGSSLHYTCGHEIDSFEFDSSNTAVTLCIRQGMIRAGGLMFVYLPSSSTTSTSSDESNPAIECTFATSTKDDSTVVSSSRRNLLYDIVARPSFGASTSSSSNGGNGVVIKLHLNMTLADVTSPSLQETEQQQTTDDGTTAIQTKHTITISY